MPAPFQHRGMSTSSLIARQQLSGCMGVAGSRNSSWWTDKVVLYYLYGGFLKLGYPRISGLFWFIVENRSIVDDLRGTPILRNLHMGFMVSTLRIPISQTVDKTRSSCVIMVCETPFVGQHLLQSDSLKSTLLRGVFVKARAGSLTGINPSTLSCGDHQTVIASSYNTVVDRPWVSKRIYGLRTELRP